MKTRLIICLFLLAMGSNVALGMMGPVGEIESVDWWPYAIKAPYGSHVDITNPYALFPGNAQFIVGATIPELPQDLTYPPISKKIAKSLGIFSSDKNYSESFSDGYYLIHFNGTIRTDWKKTLAGKGVRFTGNYIPNHAIVAYLDEQSAGIAANHSGVDWIGPYHPAYKLSTNIGQLSHHPLKGFSSNHVMLMVSLFRGGNYRLAAEMIAPYVDKIVSVDVVPGDKWGEFARIYVICEPQDSLALAQIPDVAYVEQQADSIISSVFSSNSHIQNGGLTDPTSVDASRFPIWFPSTHNLQGQGQLIGLSDTGIDYGHIGFPDPVHSRVAIGSPDAGMTLKVPKEILVGTCTTSCELDGFWEHGTGVGATAAQDFYGNDDTQWQVQTITGYGNLGPAIAHEAQILVHPWSDFSTGLTCTGTNSNVRSAWMSLIDLGVSVITTSVQFDSGNTSYDAQSESYDYVTRVHSGGEYTAMTNAAGNFGACETDHDPSNPTEPGSAPTSAGFSKNAIHVGGTEDVNSWGDMFLNSNRGPNYDERIFPDVVAPADDFTSMNTGLHMLSSNADCMDTSTDTINYSGTSYSAPVIAGAVALIHQYFEEGFYPLGSAHPTDSMDPSGALLKAIILNSAQQISGYCNNEERPGKDQGWGFPILSKVLHFQDIGPNLVVHDVTHANGFTGTGESDVYTIEVTDTTLPLKVTLAWMDWPATPGITGPALVNDLDLMVSGPAGTFYGNNFNSGAGWSVTGSYDDDLNSSENVFISDSDLIAGTYTVTVSCDSLNGGSDQGYALVVTGDLSANFYVPTLSFTGMMILIAGLSFVFVRRFKRT